MLPLAIAIAAGSGALTALAGPWVLRNVAEPTDDKAIDKIPYRQVATARFGALAGLLSGAGVLVALLSQPMVNWPAWTAFGTVGIFLAVIDARTTWIPTSLTRIGWVLVAIAVIVAGLLGGTAGAVLRSAGAAGAVWGFFLLVWFIGRGSFGFGDVRFAVMVGLVTGLQSWIQVAAAVAFGVLLGAAIGVARLLVRRQSEAFAYAPAMAVGAVLASLII